MQVKAELTKLGDAPRAYIEKIQSDNGMQLEREPSNKITMDNRFKAIETPANG